MRTVFLTALLVRIAASVLLGRMVDPASARHPDSDYHHIAAVNIINGTPVTFSVKPNYTPPYKDEVNVIKGGYAIGLSVLYRIFGVSFEVGKWANILLGALLAVGVYLLTLRLANEKAAFYSGLIVACDPYLAYLSIQVLKDVPILLCIVFSWVGYLLLDKKNTGPALLLLSVSLILASTLRPEISCLLALTFFTFSFLQQHARQVRGALLLLSLMFISVTMWPWLASFNPSNPQHPAVSLRESGKAAEYAHDNLASAERPVVLTGALNWPLRFINNVRYACNAKSHATFFPGSLRQGSISSYGGLAVFMCKAPFYLFLSPYPWRAHSKLEKMFALHMTFIYLVLPFVFIGAWKVRRNPNALAILAMATLAGTLLVLAIASPGPMVRWRMQVMSVLFAFSGIGLEEMIRSRARRVNQMSFYLEKLVIGR